MDQVTQGTAASAEESASASQELSAQAQALNQIVSELGSLVGGDSQAVNGVARGRRPVGQSGGLPNIGRGLGALKTAVAKSRPAAAPVPAAMHEFPMGDNFGEM
jgi:hypothetical protein